MTAAYGCAPVSQPDGCSLPNPPPLITDDSETRAIKIQTSEICFVPSFSLWSRWMGHKPRLDKVKAFFFSFFPWSCGDELLLTLHLCVGHKQCSTTKKDITHWSEGCVILYGRGLFDRIKKKLKQKPAQKTEKPLEIVEVMLLGLIGGRWLRVSLKLGF